MVVVVVPCQPDELLLSAVCHSDTENGEVRQTGDGRCALAYIWLRVSLYLAAELHRLLLQDNLIDGPPEEIDGGFRMASRRDALEDGRLSRRHHHVRRVLSEVISQH
ncbi:hypothetical protein EYF80_016779 [Liparis tanakae]|uniref:Uncharacterized protein n=1 Tax=Liparis tanakae TaxID=230148 RepID=A0A4Z2I4J6_9TELE|nr:hypothetical protein EYF80_016779 [Liparis tanakae]